MQQCSKLFHPSFKRLYEFYERSKKYETIFIQ